MQKTRKRKRVPLQPSSSLDPKPKQEPYPTHIRPTPEECLAIRDHLLAVHGFPQEFVKYRNQRLNHKAHNTDGVKSEPSDEDGEEESVLDGLIKTVLSQNTTETNSLKAFASLKSAFPTWQDVLDAEQKCIENAIRCGGLAPTKASCIKNILRCLLQSKGKLCLEYLRDLSINEIKAELSRFKGIGPKTVACVLLFNLQQDDFPVDTHVFEIAKAIGWVPAVADRNKTYLHLNQRIPNELKFDLNCLLFTHGKLCRNCIKKAGNHQRKESHDHSCPLLNYCCDFLTCYDCNAARIYKSWKVENKFFVNKNMRRRNEEGDNDERSLGIDSESSKAVWNKDLLHKFCDICIQAIRMGLRPHTHFNKQGWKFLVSCFAKETGHPFTQRQLKNKWDGCKTDWKIWKKLIGKETGLGWNSVLGTVEASEEWWTNKIKENKKYAKFRYGGIEPTLCDKFDTMFMNVVAVGEHAWTPSSGALDEGDNDDVGGRGNEEHGDDDDKDYNLVNLEEGSGDSEEDGVPNFVQNIDDMVAGLDVAGSSSRSSGKRKTCETAEQGRKKIKRGSGVGAQMVSILDRLVSSTETNSDCTSIRRDQKGCSVQEVMGEIHAMPEIVMGSDIHLFATEFFCDRTKREMWCSMGEPRAKLSWLQAMFRRNWRP